MEWHGSLHSPSHSAPGTQTCDRTDPAVQDSGSRNFPAAVADEERAEDNILDLLVISINRPAGSHAVELALVITGVMW